MSLNHIFDLFGFSPHDIASFWIDLEGTLIIPKNECSCGFFMFFATCNGVILLSFKGAKLK